MVAVRLLVLLAALAIVGEAAKYDIFDVIEKLTTLTKQDIIDRIKASEQASRLGVKNDDVIRLNRPLWSKFQTLRARLQTMTPAEQTVVRRLFSIARDVIDRRTTDDEVSNRIVEAFQNGGQGLCARYKRLPEDLCKSNAQPTIPGAQPTIPVPTGPSASSDGNVVALFVALANGALIKPLDKLQEPFKDSLEEAKKHVRKSVVTPENFKEIAAKIRKDLADIKAECIDQSGALNPKVNDCKDNYDATGQIIDKVYDLFTTVLPDQSRHFDSLYKNRLSFRKRQDTTAPNPENFFTNAITFTDIISLL